MRANHLIVSLAALALVAAGPACNNKNKNNPSQPVGNPTGSDGSGTGESSGSSGVSQVTPDAPFRQQAPAPGPRPEVSPPKAEEFSLKNGLKVILVERHELPLVSGVLLIKSGSDQNPKGKAGLASFTAAMLDEGTKTRSALEIARERELLGMDLGIGSDVDSIRISMSTLTETFEPSLALLSDIVRNPSFDAKELERVRDDRLTSIKQQKDQPRAMATNTFGAVVYGPDHPYGAPESGTEASVQKISKKDLQSFHSTHFVPQNAVFVLVGDVSREDVEAQLNKYFGDWKGKAPKTKTPPSPKPLAKTGVYLVDKPGAPQSTLRIGLVGIERKNPDYDAVRVMNYIFGGSFSSRLNLNLREDKGWSYGARSTFVTYKGAGPFLATAEVQSDHTADSVEETLKEIRRMVEEDISEEELSLAKSALTQSLLGAFESNGAIAATFAGLALYDLPLDYYESYAARVEAVSIEDVKRVAQKYLRPDQMAIVVVGPKEQVAEDLSKFGKVELRGPYGERL